MKIFHILVLFLSLISAAHANYNHIKLAIFDDPRPDPSCNENSQQFVNSYLSGINTAITVASEMGFSITEREFFHQNNLTSIIQQATNAKLWNPDIIIGLSTSNDFLMSKAFFGDQVILSISATDSAIVNLPTGFYSLGIPDTQAVKTIIKFISNHYPNSNLFITSAAESKESVDFGDLLAQSFKKQFKTKSVIERKFLSDDMNNLDISKFMAGYQKNDVIVIMSIGYDSAIELMNKISANLRPIKPIFITSTDNWGNNLSPKNMNGNYDVYRIDTLSGGEDTKDYKLFLDNYKKIYHAMPKDKISFVTYQAVMSFVDALKKYPHEGISSSTKQNLLNSYLLALKYNPNWYRPPYYMVYKIENKNEIFYEKIH